MRFEPVLAPAVLIFLGIVLIFIRMTALYRVLVRTGPGRYRRVVLRWCGLTLAVLLLVLAAFRPGIEPSQSRSPQQAKPHSVSSSDLNVFFVVDRSVDSRVEDYGDRKSRFSGIRADISALIDQYPRARFSVISFASKAATTWPLSDDVWGLKPMVAGLSPYTLVIPDAMYNVDAAAARIVLRMQLDMAGERYSGSKNLVFYFGVGAGGSRVSQGTFAVRDKSVAGGAVLGYGTDSGAPIPQGWVNGNLVYMADSRTGAALNSAIDEARLKAVAADLGVPYFHRESGQGIAAVIPAVQASPDHSDEAVIIATRLVERTELYWVFSLLAAGLVLTEICLTIREFRRSRLARRDVPA